MFALSLSCCLCHLQPSSSVFRFGCYLALSASLTPNSPPVSHLFFRCNWRGVLVRLPRSPASFPAIHTLDPTGLLRQLLRLVIPSDSASLPPSAPCRHAIQPISALCVVVAALPYSRRHERAEPVAEERSLLTVCAAACLLYSSHRASPLWSFFFRLLSTILERVAGACGGLAPISLFSAPSSRQ